MKFRIPILIIVILFGLVACQQKDSQKTKKSDKIVSTNENSVSNTFLNKINQLHTGKIDSFVLQANKTIKVNPLGEDLSEIASEEVNKEKIILQDYKPLTRADILKIDDEYILVVMHNKHSDEIRAATFSQGGKPFESILLFSNKGNNDFKISRSYSYHEDIPFKYDSLNNTFEFTDLRYDTEWIEYPVKGKDTLTYKVNFKVKVNDRGRFEKVLPTK